MRKSLLLTSLFGVVLYLYSCATTKKKDSTNFNIIYKATISSSCATTDIGPIMIEDYCSLNFKSDSVKIHFYEEINDKPNEGNWEIYSYRTNMDTIKIKGFTYSILIQKKDTLIYTDNKNNLRFKFVKQK